jgi:ferredoxin
VRVDAETCTGHGRCYALGPDVFGADEFGHCEILVPDGEVPPDLEGQARAGRDNCPELAITLEEQADEDRARS